MKSLENILILFLKTCMRVVLSMMMRMRRVLFTLTVITVAKSLMSIGELALTVDGNTN
jgi:hypothetical protein